ncbi:MAG: hypothetical protein GC164_12100 [Phycisphaera sp.]|nr:hypothetical protein [Phycisphaera sp.]
MQRLAVWNLLLAAAVCSLATDPARGAFISEISFASRTSPSGQTIPRYVEISAAKNAGPLDLVITDARSSPNSFGRVLEVVHLPSGPDVRLVALHTSSQPGWPSGLYPLDVPSPTPGLFTDHTQDSALTYSVTSLSFILFDRTTTVQPYSSIQVQTAAWQSANVLDALTVGPTGSTWTSTLDPTSSLLSLGTSDDLLTTPATSKTWPTATSSMTYLTGHTNPNSYTLANINYTLNPGLANLPFSGSQNHLPEPGTPVLLAVGSLLACGRNRCGGWKSPSHGV